MDTYDTWVYNNNNSDRNKKISSLCDYGDTG